jgi:hypothetical protein
LAIRLSGIYRDRNAATDYPAGCPGIEECRSVRFQIFNYLFVSDDPTGTLAAQRPPSRPRGVTGDAGAVLRPDRFSSSALFLRPSFPRLLSAGRRQPAGRFYAVTSVVGTRDQWSSTAIVGGERCPQAGSWSLAFLIIYASRRARIP